MLLQTTGEIEMIIVHTIFGVYNKETVIEYYHKISNNHHSNDRSVFDKLTGEAS